MAGLLLDPPSPLRANSPLMRAPKKRKRKRRWGWEQGLVQPTLTSGSSTGVCRGCSVCACVFMLLHCALTHMYMYV